MTILSVVQSVCAKVGVVVPTSVFSGIASNRTMTEFAELADEMAQRIAYDQRDWSLFKATATFHGDGVATAFNVPVDYKRMLLTSNVWRSTSTLMPMTFIPDLDEWLNRRASNYYSSAGEWTNYGGQIHIAPTLAAGQSVYFAYLRKNCINLASGGMGDVFMADGDSFALDERLLKLGMIWQWKSDKGTPYAEDLGTYGDALGVAMGHDSPSPIIIGRRPISSSVRVAYPFPVPT